VLGVQVVAMIVPFTPGGAGVQQALLLTVFAGSATASQVAAFSVGQQIALAAAAVGMGFGALVLIFRFKSFREVVRRGREHRRAEEAPDKVTPASSF
jgi:glycosyltransferase 2 family protein